MVHINVRSLRPKVNEFAILLDSNNFDVITVSETWLDSTIENALLAMEGYDLYRSDRMRLGVTGSKKGGGLAMYVQNECVRPIEIFSS